MPSADLREQVVVVTGAGRGIGRAIALAVGRAGARVVAAARTEGEVARVAEEIQSAGGTAAAEVVDLQHETSIKALFERLRRDHRRLDVLINNAGIGRFGPTADFTSDDLDAVLSTNVRGTFLCCREALKLMLPARRGYIINIASVVGFKGYPLQAAYAASKHAVMGLTKSIAAEVHAQRVRVSGILPGGVDTDLVGDARPDLKRDDLMRPEDVAQSVLYLLSLSDRAAVDQIYIRRRTSTPF